MEHSKIDILLSTYNGETYINQLIDSLLEQTYENWRLLIRDDGSKDNTINIINKYQNSHPGKIKVLEAHKNLGPSKSFAVLLGHSDAEYMMFCDQDDIWLPEKVEQTLKKMEELEERYPNMPLLVHTDLKVVDQTLNTISPSLFEYQHLSPERKSLNSLLIQNNVTGCTVMVNKQLKNLSLPIPKEAIMHDWWIALNASAFGKIGYVPSQTILYRQHGKNDTGAKRYSIQYFLERVGNLDESIKSNQRILKQSEAFMEINKKQLTKEQYKLISNFATFFAKGRIKRLSKLIRYQYKKYGALRNLGFITTLMLAKRENSH